MENLQQQAQEQIEEEKKQRKIELIKSRLFWIERTKKEIKKTEAQIKQIESGEWEEYNNREGECLSTSR